MKNRRRSRWLFLSSAYLLFIVVPMLVYFVLYTRDKTEYVNQRNFRVLAEVRDEFRDRFVQIVPLFKFNQYPKDWALAEALGKPPTRTTEDMLDLVDRLSATQSARLARRTSLRRRIDAVEASYDAAELAVVEAETEMVAARNANLRKLREASRELARLHGLDGEASEDGNEAARAELTKEIGIFLGASEQIDKAAREGFRVAKARSERLDVVRSLAAVGRPRSVGSGQALESLQDFVRYRERIRKNPAYESVEFRRVRDSTELERLCGAADDHVAEESNVRYGFSGHSPTARLTFTECGSEDRGLQVALDVADQLPRTSELEDFSGLIVASKQGRVIHQQGKAVAEFTNIGRLTTPPKDPEESADSSGSSGSYPRIDTVDFGATSYRVYIQPFALPLELAGVGSGQRTGDYFLIGVIEQSAFNTQVSSVPLKVWSLLAAGLLLGLLVWPWLKIWYISPSERLRRGDAYLVAGSLLVGSAVVALIALNVLAFFAFWQSRDAISQRIAENVSRDFSDELHETLPLLVDVQSQIQACAREQYVLGWLTSIGPRCPIRPFPREDGVHQYPSFELAFLLDGRGVEVGQLSYRDAVTTKARVPDRIYFQKAIRGDLWSFRVAPASDPFEAFVDRIHTKDHGIKLSVLSTRLEKPLPVHPRADSRRARAGSETVDAEVAVIVKRFHSLWNPVLPQGYGFAVVRDEDGRVLYHSDDDRALVENFFVEADRSPALLASVAGRRSEHIDGRYRGSDHHFYTQPLAELPWTVVVFFDARYVESVMFHFAVTVGTQVLIYTALLLAVIGLSAALLRRRRWSWLWPQQDLYARYRVAVWALLSLIGFYLLAIFRLSGLQLVVPLFAVPVFTASVLYLGLNERLPAMKGRRVAAWLGLVVGIAGLFSVAVNVLAVDDPFTYPALSPQTSYWLAFGLLAAASLGVAFSCLALLTADDARAGNPDQFKRTFCRVGFCTVVIVSVLPAVAIYKDAFEVHAENFTKTDQLALATAYEHRAEALWADAHRLRPGAYDLDGRPRNGGPIVRSGFDAQRGVYAFAAQTSGDSDVLENRIDDARYAVVTDDCFAKIERARVGAASSEDEAIRTGEWLARLLASPLRLLFPVDQVERSISRVQAQPDSELPPKGRTPFDSLSASVARTFRPTFDATFGVLSHGLLAAGQNPNWTWLTEPFPRRSESAAMTTFLCTVDSTGDRGALYESRTAGIPMPRSAGTGLAGGLVLLIGVFTLWQIVRSASVRLLGIDLVELRGRPRDYEPDAELLERSHVIVRPSPEFVEKLSALLAGLGYREDKYALAGMSDGEIRERSRIQVYEVDPPPGSGLPRRLLIVTDVVPVLTDRELRRSLLSVLERHVHRDGLPAFILADIAMFDRIANPASYPEPIDPEIASDVEERLRWARVFEGFEKLRFRIPDYERECERTESFARETLIRETGWHPLLQPTRRRLEPQVPDAKWERRPRLTELRLTLKSLFTRAPAPTEGQIVDPNQIIGQVFDEAGSLYRRMWLGCTTHERLLLIHLARGHLVNPRSTEILRRLMRRGLIRRHPQFSIVSESFRRFVLQAESPDQIEKWEHETATDDVWSMIRIPLLLILGAVAAFVAWSGGDVTESPIAIIPAVGAVASIVLRTIGSLRTGAVASAKAPDDTQNVA